MGIIVGVKGSAFYKLNTSDTISPSSLSILLGVYTCNNSYLGFVAQKYNFIEDKWRAKIIVINNSKV